MKNKLNRFSAICFAISAVLLLTTITLAAYTSLSSVKRVVTVKGTEQLFSSNILIPYTNDNELQTRIVSFAEDSEVKIFYVDVTNYIQGDSTKHDTYGIHYNLNVEVVDTAGNRITDPAIYGSYKVNNTNLTQNSYVINGEFLDGRRASKISYTIEVPLQYMSLYRLKVTAVPDEITYSAIGRIIATSTETYTSHWTGKFLDTEETAVNSNEELGIINYQISGHVEEICTLSWDTSKVEIDKWFLNDMRDAGMISGDITTNGTRKSVQLRLGGTESADQYNVVFYRTKSAKDVNDSWSTITNTETGYITFKNAVTE